MTIKTNIVDMAEVRKLEKFIDGKMYSVAKSTQRGLEISVVVPFGTPRGLVTFALVMRQFIRIAWGVIA